jgi:hypothetical protein
VPRLRWRHAGRAAAIAVTSLLAGCGGSGGRPLSGPQYLRALEAVVAQLRRPESKVALRLPRQPAPAAGGVLSLHVTLRVTSPAAARHAADELDRLVPPPAARRALRAYADSFGAAFSRRLLETTSLPALKAAVCAQVAPLDRAAAALRSAGYAPPWLRPAWYPC